MTYFEYHVKLTNGQKRKLLTSYRKKAPITLRLKHNQLSGNDKLLLTQSQIRKIEKSKRDRTGSDVKISQTQIRKQSGGFIGALLPTLARVGSMALPWVTKAAAPLMTGALSGLASMGVNKAFGGGLFSIPQNKVDRLVQYADYLTETPKKQILEALQTGSGIKQFRITQEQQGSGLGTILATIGIPMLINALTGKGLQVDSNKIRSSRSVYVPKTKKDGKGLQVDSNRIRSSRSVYVPKPKKGGLVSYYKSPPPFIGSWDQYKNPVGLGMVKKKTMKRKGKKGKGLILGKNSPLRGIPILGDIF